MKTGTSFKKRRPLRLFALLIAWILTLSLASCVGGKPDGAHTDESSSSPTPVNPPSDISGADTVKRVALTFDDGPQHYEERTKAIVDELGKYGYTATFFVVGNRIAGGNALAYAVEHGCEIGIHGYTHEYYYDVCTDEEYEKEIGKTVTAIQNAIPGYDIRLMRPIGGKISPERAAASPYSVILWNVDSADWENKYASGDSVEVAAEKVNTTVNNIMSAVSDGDVILMHDIYQSTYDAVILLLQRLHAEGYEVVTVSELFGDSLAPGQVYTNAG